jgi:hypothetical protein
MATDVPVEKKKDIETGSENDSDSGPEGQPVGFSGELVVRSRSASVASSGREYLTQLRSRVGSRLPEVARHPAVVMTASAIATVGVGLAVGGARQSMARAVSKGTASPPLVVTGYVVHHVHVMHHHVVHHLPPPALPPR